MSVRSGYRQTDLGPIPEDWDVQPLAARGAFAKGSGVRKDQANSGTIPCVRYGELYTDHHEVIRRFPSKISVEVARAARRLSPGDIVFAGSGETKEEIGKCAAFVDEIEAYAGGDTIIFSPRHDDPLFLGYALNQPLAVRHKVARGQGDAVVHISSRALGDLRLPFPPFPEQRAIAEALSDVDTLLNALDRLIAKKRDLKQAAMQQLLTGQTRLPGFSGAWEVERLSELADIRSGGTPSTSDARNWNGPVAWCTPTDITALGGRKYLSSTARTITPQGLATSSAELIPANSVVMTSRATIGECAINVAPITTNQGFKNFVPRQNTDTEFLYYLLSTQKQAFISLCGGSTFLEIGKTQLAMFEVSLPGQKREQTAIATVLSDMDAELEALEQRRAKTAALKQGMMQELLTGRTRLV